MNLKLPQRIVNEIQSWMVPVVVMVLVALLAWGASSYQASIARDDQKALAKAEAIWLRDQLDMQIREHESIRLENDALHKRIDTELRSYRKEMVQEIKSIRQSLDHVAYRLQHEEKRNSKQCSEIHTLQERCGFELSVPGIRLQDALDEQKMFGD